MENYLYIVLYIAIGIFFVGAMNGYAYEKFEGVCVLFILFYPILIVIMLVLGIVCGLYKIGEKLGRKIEELLSNMDW